MLIIVEGPNKSGKTTLANILHERLAKSLLLTQSEQYKYYNEEVAMHMYNRLFDNVRTSTMLNFYFECVKPKGMHLIIDRFHISAAVYSKLIRGDEQVVGDMFCLEEKFKNDSVLVFPQVLSTWDKSKLLKRQIEYDDVVEGENDLFANMLIDSNICIKLPIDFDNPEVGIENVITSTYRIENVNDSY